MRGSIRRQNDEREGRAPESSLSGQSVSGVQPVEKEGRHHALLGLFTLLWGGNFILAQVALREMAPIAFSVTRFAAGGAALLALLWVGYRKRAVRDGTPLRLLPRIGRSDWPRMLLVSALGAAIAPWMGIEGLALTNGGRASLWLALGPVMSSGIGLLSRTERLGMPGFVGAGLACLGTFVLAADGVSYGQNFWLGDLLLFGSLVLVVWELHLIKPMASKYGPTPVVAVRTLLGGVVYGLIAMPSLVRVCWVDLGAWTWFAILFGGAIGVGVGQLIKVRALRTLGPTRVVVYGNLVPIAAFAIGWLVLGETPTLLAVLAAGMILIGALLLQLVDQRGWDWRFLADSTRLDS